MRARWLTATKVRRYYVKNVRDHLSPIAQQRLKLVIWDVWGYHVLLRSTAWSWADRLWLLRRFLAVDWSVEHSHKPEEAALVVDALGRTARGALIEAGCWKGGASAKFSHACARRGRELHVFDSFEGVQQNHVEPGEPNYDGSFAAPMDLLSDALRRYGDENVVKIHPGWFVDTMIPEEMPAEVAVVYIDCDTVEGTFDVLRAVRSRLTESCAVFSQDYGIEAVRRALDDPVRWTAEGLEPPVEVRERVYFTAELVLE